MTQYKLKKGIENFDVVDGAFAGRKFVRGKEYSKIPSEEKKKFDEIKPVVISEKKAEGSLRPIGAYAPVGEHRAKSKKTTPKP